MAKRKPIETEGTSPPAGTTAIVVVLRKPATFAGGEQPAGTKLAEIQLEPGVSLNYQVDAVRCDLACRDKSGN